MSANRRVTLITLAGAAMTLAAVSAGATASAAARSVDGSASHVRDEITHTSGFSATADTYVSKASPRRSFGRTGTLAVSRHPRRASYIRFSVDGLGARVSRARLLLHSVRGGGRFEVRRTTARWNESTRYAASPRGTGFAILARARRGWTSVNVTRLVRGDGDVNLVFRSKSARRLAFSSRERGAKAPRLIIDVRPAPGPASPVPAPDTSPKTGYSGRVGVVSSTIWYPEAEQLAYLQALRAGGVTWVREDFSWGAFERSPGVWKWDVGDKFMRSVATAGLNVLGTIAYSAGWAASGPTIYHPPKDFSQYANFCRVLLDRYGVNGTFWQDNPALTPRPLRAVEIWNEPWHEYFWRPLPDPAAYAGLVRAAATVIRQSHPEVTILASGDIFQGRSDTTRSLDWFGPLVRSDPTLFRDLVDAYSVHLYTQDRSPLDAKTEQRWRFDRVLMTQSLARAAGADQPLWITEFGWNTFAGDKDSVNEETQARYMREALDLAVRTWGDFVPISFVYNYGKATNDFNGGYSFHRPDGSMKPSWDSLKALLGVA